MATDSKVRMSFSIDAATKEQLDKIKEAGIELNLSSVISNILQFNFRAVETFIECMKRIHEPEKNGFTRINVKNGILVLGEIEETQKIDYLRGEKLDNPEIIRLLNKIVDEKSKLEENKEDSSSGVEKQLKKAEQRISNLEKLILAHHTEIKKTDALVKEKLYKEELKELEKKYNMKLIIQDD
jgi:dGTP triphosphohydrolase